MSIVRLSVCVFAFQTIFFPRTTGIQICLNKGPRPLPRGDNSGTLKILSRTTGQISTIIGTKHPWAKGIQFCLNKGSYLFQKGYDKDIVKINYNDFQKSFPPERDVPIF